MQQVGNIADMMLSASGMSTQNLSGRGGQRLRANTSDESLRSREESREEEEERERGNLGIRKHGRLAEDGQTVSNNMISIGYVSRPTGGF